MIITDKALREMIREVIDNRAYGVSSVSTASKVNPVVDPSASMTDATHNDTVPQNKAELDVAVKNVTKHLPDEKIPNVFRAARAATEDDEEMKKNEPKKSSSVSEESLRKTIRDVLSEVKPRKLANGYDDSDYDDDVEDKDNESRLDPDGVEYNSIGDAIGGLSPAGAKRAVDHALMKFKFLYELDPDDREIFILTVMNNYINLLANTGELSEEDVGMLKQHPDIVRELDGFREYLGKQFDIALKDAGHYRPEGHRVDPHGKKLEDLE